MKRAIQILVGCLILSFVVAAETVTVNGRVVDQATRKPLPGVRVSLFALTGTWKFWTLPEQTLLMSQQTNESGGFALQGEASRYYVVEINVQDCWAPYKKVFDLRDHGGRVEGLEILTWLTPCRER